jgi:chemotaxis response regulator CheB
MKYIIIHPKNSVAIFIKLLLSRLTKEVEISTVKKLEEVEETSLHKQDIIFLLTSDFNLSYFEQIKNKARFIAVENTLKSFSITLKSELLDTSKINELGKELEDILLRVDKQESCSFPQTQKVESALSNKVDLVLIGISTGGPKLLKTVLKALSPNNVPILIAQHLPKGFSSNLIDDFKDGLHSFIEVENATELKQGQIAIAKAGLDVEVLFTNGSFLAITKEINHDPYHPSVNRLFFSASKISKKIAGIVFTGMGKDGAEGAKVMVREKHTIIIQDPVTCAVDGMPRAIITSGVECKVLTPEQIIKQINKWSNLYQG